ncbi:LysR family transcriptional regulator [Longispora sp. NPDC051575]|uniref:LysR family transcriptional regulator n=1 Tax=Longispora sp. NPDC051575 TaxID=3154943 RepID=UPI0034452511
MSDLTPAELRVLTAVDREGSFSAAAARLGLTQSAVSYAVRGIERKIGVVLFDRDRNGARPTAAGARAVRGAHRVLRLLDVLPADARAAAGGDLSGRVRIAAFRSAAAGLLPAALAELRDRHPDLTYEVAVVRDVGPGTAGEVLAGRADLAVVNLPHRLPASSGLVSGTLFRAPYVLVHPAGHPDPRQLPLLNWDENCAAETRRWFAAQDWLPPAHITVADDSALLAMVGHGLGMAIVPRLTAVDLPASIASTDLGPGAPTGAVGHVSTPELARGTAVRDLLRALRRVGAGLRAQEH